MSDLDVKITGININTRPHKWDNGDTALAFFDISARGFDIKSCLLIKRKSGGLIMTMPRGEHESGRRMIYCHDQQLLDVITSSAKRAFENLGGKI
jgi:hypothetical protein